MKKTLLFLILLLSYAVTFGQNRPTNPKRLNQNDLFYEPSTHRYWGFTNPSWFLYPDSTYIKQFITSGQSNIGFKEGQFINTGALNNARIELRHDSIGLGRFLTFNPTTFHIAVDTNHYFTLYGDNIVHGNTLFKGNVVSNLAVYTPLLSNLVTQDYAKISLKDTGLYLSGNRADAHPIVIINNENASFTGSLLSVKNQSTPIFVIPKKLGNASVGGDSTLNIGINGVVKKSPIFSIDANNGLINNAGIIQLGGNPLNQNTVVNLTNSFLLDIESGGFPVRTRFVMDPTAAIPFINIEANSPDGLQGAYTRYNGSSYYGYTAGRGGTTGVQQIQFVDTAMVVLDNQSGKGFQYAGNYIGANLSNPNWLTSKRYVDSLHTVTTYLPLGLADQTLTGNRMVNIGTNQLLFSAVNGFGGSTFVIDRNGYRMTTDNWNDNGFGGQLSLDTTQFNLYKVATNNNRYNVISLNDGMQINKTMAGKVQGFNWGTDRSIATGIEIQNHLDSAGLKYRDLASYKYGGLDTLWLPNLGYNQRHFAPLSSIITYTASNGVVKTGSNFTSDTTYTRTVANSLSLAAMQSKFATNSPILGTIFNSTLVTSEASKFTSVVSAGTFTFGGSGLTIAGTSSGLFNDYTYWNDHKILYTDWLMKATITVTSNTSGLGFGYFQPGAYGNPVAFLTSTGAVAIYISGIQVAISSNTLSISAGDVIEITVNKIHRHVQAEITKISDGTSVTANASIANTAIATNNMQQLGYPTIVEGASGTGNYLVTSLSFETYKKRNALFATIGDSVTDWAFPGTDGDRWAAIFGRAIQNGYTQEEFAIDGVTLTDAINSVADIILAHPQYALIDLGLNDIKAGASAATALARLTTLIGLLKAAKIQPVIITPNPFHTGDAANPGLSTLHTSLTTTSPWMDYPIIDTWAAIVQSGQNYIATIYDNGDGHPNKAGHLLMAETIVKALDAYNLKTGGSLYVDKDVLTSGNITFDNPTSAMLKFGASGVGVPTLTTSSVGSRVVLYPNADGSHADHALGVAAGLSWYSVPNSASGWGWYAATTPVTTLSGLGDLVTAGNLTGSGGTLSLNNGTSNLLSFAAAGLGTPTVTTRSPGTKVVWYPQLSGSLVDYATGITSPSLWNSVPNSAAHFDWYAGTTNLATLLGNGNLSVIGTLASTGINLSGLTASKVVFTDGSKNLTSTGFGTSSQFIMGDGSLNSNTYALSSTSAIHGNSTTTGTATTAVTVTIGSTMANTTYNTSITPRDLLTAVNYYISAQTTTTFTVTFVSALTGSIAFDWNINP